MVVLKKIKNALSNEDLLNALMDVDKDGKTMFNNFVTNSLSQPLKRAAVKDLIKKVNDDFVKALGLLEGVIAKVKALKEFAKSNGRDYDGFVKALEVLNFYLNGYSVKVGLNFNDNVKTLRTKISKFLTQVFTKKNYYKLIKDKNKVWTDVLEGNEQAFVSGLKKNGVFSSLFPGLGTINHLRRMNNLFDNALKGDEKSFIELVRFIKEQLAFCEAATSTWLELTESINGGLYLERLKLSATFDLLKKLVKASSTVTFTNAKKLCNDFLSKVSVNPDVLVSNVVSVLRAGSVGSARVESTNFFGLLISLAVNKYGSSHVIDLTGVNGSLNYLGYGLVKGKKLTVKGNFKGNNVGAQMSGGELVINGSLKGNYAGANMKGGSLTVAGDVVGNYVGGLMEGGKLVINGSLNGDYAGSNMKGGSLTVAGDVVGNYVGGLMEGGKLVIRGSLNGDYAGSNMKGGSLLVEDGVIGNNFGEKMVGGKIVVLNNLTGDNLGKDIKDGKILISNLAYTNSKVKYKENNYIKIYNYKSKKKP